MDLRPWGYAPGFYTFTCIDCPPSNAFGLNMAAKRAWRCEKHALQAKAIDLEFPPPPPPPKTMDFNVNHYVRVKLNDTGLAELKRQHEELRQRAPMIGAWSPPKTDEEGWSKYQLHDLMKSLGHLCTLGRVPPFETTIQIILDQR